MKTALPRRFYGDALVNADGTTVFISPNLSIAKGSAGSYLVQPAHHFTVDQLVPETQIADLIPFIVSALFGGGPTSDGMSIAIYNSLTQAQADHPFYIALYTRGVNDFTSGPTPY